MAEPQSCTLAKGYLLKHNRDHRRSNLLPGATYKRRWVEVTEHTFVYSPSQQDALTGHCSVFAVADMVWVKADGDTKFLVKFPERTLKFKVAAGGKAEREQWVAALQAARKQHTAATQALNSGAAKLEHLQKALLSPGPGLMASDRTSAESCSSGMVLSSAGTSLAGSTLAGAAPAASSANAMPHGLTWTSSGFGGTLEQQIESGQQQPLSPRSLLASARAGMALVNSAAGTPRARTPPHAGAAAAAATAQLKPAQERFFAQQAYDSEDDEEEEEEEEEDAASEAGSSDRDAEQHPHGDRSEAVDHAGGPADSQAAAAEAAAEPAAHRPVLARRMTPGVLLASPRAPTPLAASPAHASPAGPQAPQPSTLAANPLSRVALGPAAAAAVSPPAPARTLSAAQADEVLRLDDSSDSEPDSPAAQQQHASYPPASTPGRAQPALDVYSTPLYSTHRQSSASRSRLPNAGPTSAVAAAAAAAEMSGDEVLRLDEEDVLSTPLSPLSGAQQQHHGQQALCSSTGLVEAATEAAASSTQQRGLRPGMLQVRSRPGSGDSSRSGSAYRPGTPLKSCLRNSPSTNPASYTS